MHEIACTRMQTQTSGGSLIADLQCAATLRYHPMSFSYSNSIAANTTSKAHAKALCAAECETYRVYCRPSSCSTSIAAADDGFGCSADAPTLTPTACIASAPTLSRADQML